MAENSVCLCDGTKSNKRMTEENTRREVYGTEKDKRVYGDVEGCRLCGERVDGRQGGYSYNFIDVVGIVTLCQDCNWLLYAEMAKQEKIEHWAAHLAQQLTEENNDVEK